MGIRTSRRVGNKNLYGTAVEPKQDLTIRSPLYCTIEAIRLRNLIDG